MWYNVAVNNCTVSTIQQIKKSNDLESRADEIMDILYKLIGDARCELNYTSPFQLLIAVILSAQCTDVRVNIVTKKLFEVVPDAESLADLDIQTIQDIIKPLGFFRTKSANIKKTAKQLVQDFDGVVPNDRQQLTSLAGVGQKTANVVLHECFLQPLIAVDTHVFRVAHRLGLSNANTPSGVEEDLYKAINPSKHFITHHTLLLFGRYRCTAQRPKCNGCVVKDYCLVSKDDST